MMNLPLFFLFCLFSVSWYPLITEILAKATVNARMVETDECTESSKHWNWK